MILSRSRKSLQLDHIQIMSGDEINPLLFDALIEKIALTTNDVVINNGVSSFVPLSHYLISNQGTPAVVWALDKFLEYAKKHEGLWFARKDEIAEWMLSN